MAQSDFTPRREEKRALQKGKRESCFLCKSKSRTDEAVLIFLMANYPTLNFRVTDDDFDFICSSFTRISSSPPQFLWGSCESRFWLKKVKSGSDVLFSCPPFLSQVSRSSRGLIHTLHTAHLLTKLVSPETYQTEMVEKPSRNLLMCVAICYPWPAFVLLQTCRGCDKEFQRVLFRAVLGRQNFPS